MEEQKVEETMSYYDYASTQIRTNNPLERIIREIRRRTRVVGAFPALGFDVRLPVGIAWRMAAADTFANVHYEASKDPFVVTMLCRGTNPDHTFSLP